MTPGKLDMRRCLTLKYPWCQLVMGAGPSLPPLKPVENRSWQLAWRGRLWIHAGKSYDTQGAVSLIKWARLPPPWLAKIEAELRMKTKEREAALPGGILGHVELTTIVRDCPSDYAIPGHFHWMLANPTKTEFEPCGGSQGVWFAGDNLVQSAH